MLSQQLFEPPVQVLCIFGVDRCFGIILLRIVEDQLHIVHERFERLVFVAIELMLHIFQV